MNQKTRTSGRESGQGTVEYLLLLMITIMVVLGIIYQFNQAFKTYTEAFFDGYIKCLLDTGELPGSAECQEEFKNFNLSDGKKLVNGTIPSPGPPGGSSGGSGGSSGGSGSGSKSGSENQAGNKSGSQGNDSTKGSDDGQGSEIRRSSSGGSGSNYMGSASSQGFKTRPKSTAVGRFDSEETPEKSSLEGPDSLIGAAPGTQVGSVAGAGGRSTGLDRNFSYFGQEEEKDRAASRAPITAVAKKSDDDSSLRPRKTTVNLNRSTASVNTGDEEGFSFGGFLRILLIVVIVIAIVIFFGGQLLQISKSQEK